MEYIFALLLSTQAHALQFNTPEDTAKIFAKGKAALAELKSAGAKLNIGISPSRKDMIFTLISDHLPETIRIDSFGLHLRGAISEEEQIRLEKKYGIKIEGPCNWATHPACYASLPKTILPDRAALINTMKAILSQEPNIWNVSYNSFEQSQEN